MTRAEIAHALEIAAPAELEREGFCLCRFGILTLAAGSLAGALAFLVAVL